MLDCDWSSDVCSSDLFVNVPFAVQQRIQSELQSGEVVRWSGQPDPREAAKGAYAILLFAIPWTAFALFWIAGASGFRWPDFHRGPQALFPLFGLPFVAVGVGMLLSPVWARRQARRTYYVVTDRRAVIFTDGPTATVRSFGSRELQNLERIQKPDGSGSIYFGGYVPPAGHRRLPQRLGFLGIRDVRAVEGLLAALAKN
jgi:hypothetical protein